MEFLKEHVGTQYKDYYGLASVDFHGMSQDLFSLCRDYGIDTELKFPIGFRISEFTTDGIGQREGANITIFTIDKNENGNSFDDIEQSISNQDGNITVDSNLIVVPYDQLGKYIKRFDIVVINHLRERISEFTINEEE